MIRSTRRLGPIGLTVVTLFALAALPAQGATPPRPSATTTPASNVGSITAQLNGVVNTHGQSAQWAFQFGRTTAYGRETPTRTIPAGQSNTVSVKAQVLHLTPNSTYHFRLVVRSGIPGSRYYYVQFSVGKDLTFHTQKTGRLVLAHTILKIKNGHAKVVLTCASNLKCVGHFSIDFHFRGKKVACVTSKAFTIARHKAKRVNTKLSARCINDVRKSKGHKRIALLSSRLPTAQHAVIKSVVLEL
jgi:hypothetical protein